MKLLLLVIPIVFSNGAFSGVYGLLNSVEVINYDDIKFSKAYNCSGTIKSVSFKLIENNSPLFSIIDHNNSNSEIVVVSYKNKNLNGCNGVVFTDDSTVFGLSLYNAIGKMFRVNCIEKVEVKDRKIAQICEYEVK